MKKLLLILSLVGFVFISCEEDEPVQPNDSVLTKANISGSLKLYDEHNTAVSKSGMVVSLEGGSGSGYYWGESEKDGSFLILNAPYFQNYTIVYQKNGYGTYKSYGYNHEYTGSAGNIPTVFSLGKISSTHVTALDVSESMNNVAFEISISPAPGDDTYVRFLFHSISEISNKVFSNYTSLQAISISEKTYVFSKAQLLELGLESGTKYWVQAYGDSYHSNGYFDEYNMKHVLPNLGFDENSPVPTDDFVMP